MQTTTARLLIVDDEHLVRDMLAELFECDSTQVLTASNAREAIRLLSEHHFDVVISDIVMPEGDGIELLLEMKRSAHGAPLIAISAPTNQLYLQAIKRLGAVQCFEKPLDLQALQDAVQRLLDDPLPRPDDFS